MTTAADWIRYANQGATRNMPLDGRLLDALSFLPELGLTMEVFSGGQPAKGSGRPRVGSTRHDHGNAADVFFYRDGQRLDWANDEHRPIFEDIVRRGKAAGITGFGAGPGYMQPGSMHVGFGNPGVWGAGGSGRSAPDWLRAAYEGGGQPQMVAQAQRPAPQNPGTPAPQLPAPQNIADRGVAPVQQPAPSPQIAMAPAQPEQSVLGSMMAGFVPPKNMMQPQQPAQPVQMGDPAGAQAVLQNAMGLQERGKKLKSEFMPDLDAILGLGAKRTA